MVLVNVLLNSGKRTDGNKVAQCALSLIRDGFNGMVLSNALGLGESIFRRVSLDMFFYFRSGWEGGSLPILQTIIGAEKEQSGEQQIAACMGLLREMLRAVSGCILPPRLVDALGCVEQLCGEFSDKDWATGCLRTIRRALIKHERATAALESQ